MEEGSSSVAAVPEKVNEVHINGAKECAAKEVTVFADRAEVCRLVEHKAEEKGRLDVYVEGLSQYVNMDSVRVSGSKGKIVLLDMTVTRKTIQAVEVEKGKVAELREKLQKLEEETASVDCDISALGSAESWLGQMADCMCQGAEKGDFNAANMPGNAMENIHNFAQFLRGDLSTSKKEMWKLKKKLEELNEEKKALESELNGISRKRPSVQTVVCISFEVKKAGNIGFLLNYVVTKASWISRYESRYESEKGTINLTYFGMVSNRTGEDWVDAEIVLSTATPAIGGTPFLLQEKTVDIYEPPRIKARAGGMAKRAYAARMCEADMERVCCDEDAVCENSDSDMTDVAVYAAETNSNLSATTFHIPRAATILSDNEEHKLTIGVVSNMDTTVKRVIRPANNTFAFIKATLKNTSPYIFLPGPCSVFVDGYLVSTTDMNEVAANEKFSFFLGPDKNLRITWREPVSKRGESGFVMKSNMNTYEGSVSIKNAGPQKVDFVAAIAIPKSLNSKVKVTLMSPVVNETDVKMNTRNHVKQYGSLEADASITIPIKYTIEYPKDTTINVN